MPEVVGAHWFGVVGLSLSSAGKLPDLAASIRTIRAASRNPGIAVMVGGPVFVEQPGLVAEVGADATARDARQAAATASQLASQEAGGRPHRS